MTTASDDLHRLVYGDQAPPGPGDDADVTADLVVRVVHDAPALAGTLVAMLGDVHRHRDEYRAVLLAHDLIHPLPPPALSRMSIAAVDGGCVVEPLYAVDLVTVVAASAGSIHPVGGHPLLTDHVVDVIPHSARNDAFAKAAMFTLELSVLARLDHALRIIDGSHLTPVVNLLEGLFKTTGHASDRLCDLIDDRAAVDAAHVLSDYDADSRVVALPKADTSSEFVDAYHADFGFDIKVLDKTFAAQVLNPGEFLAPRNVTDRSLFVSGIHPTLPARPTGVLNRLESALAPLRAALKAGRLQATYLKPHTSDTAVKMQFLTRDPADALTDAATLGRVVADETPGPDLQEPFPQYAADLAAKNVSLAAAGFKHNLLASLPPEAQDYITLLLRQYRTGRAR